MGGLTCMVHLEQDCTVAPFAGMRMSGAKEMALVQEQVHYDCVVPVAEGTRMFCPVWNQQEEKNDAVVATSHCHLVLA